MRITVILSTSLSALAALMTSFRPTGSSIAVGSSRMMHWGCMAMTPAMDTRCFWPPERWSGEYFLYSSIPTALRLSSTRSQISEVGTPMFSGPKPTSSSTTWPIIWLSGFWKTMPALCLISQRRSSSAVFMPLTQTAPSVGYRSALKCFARVDFPEPLWPRIAMNCPFSTDMSTPSTAVVMPSTLPSSSRLMYSYFRACVRSISPIDTLVYKKTGSEASLTPRMFLYDQTSSRTTIIAASPLRGPIFTVRVYPPLRLAYLGPISSKSFWTRSMFFVFFLRPAASFGTSVTG